MQVDPRTELRFTRTPNIKEGNAQDKRQEILDYFINTYRIYEELFSVITEDKSYYIKAEPLRHPLIFYFGHTATFFMNKLLLGGHINERVNPRLESMFAVGVDENDWDDLNEAHYDWPSVREVQDYRDKIKQIVIKKIEEAPLCLPIEWDSFWWVIIMGIEHERLHIETSSVIIRRLKPEFVHPEGLFPVCPRQLHSGYDANGHPNIDESSFPRNELKKVTGGKVVLGKEDPHYGWDNEYGRYEEDLVDFKASVFLVSNYEFFEFMQDSGYENKDYWTEEGWKWNRSTKMTHPVFWIPYKDSVGRTLYRYKAFAEVIDMPWDWPVETNYLEAKAYCNWKSEKTGKELRLPSECEYYQLRDSIYKGVDAFNWDFGSVGNINLEQWASSTPVDMNGKDGFYDVIGNVWQHSDSIWDAFDGFKVHPLYDDFSTPNFDNQHTMLKGGSWATTGESALRIYRVGFRSHFYQFAGFRYVESKNKIIVNQNKCETDKEVTQFIEFHYGEQYLDVENFPKKCAEVCIDAAKKLDIPMKKAMDLGCALGRTTFELAKAFDEVIGFDLSVRFFQFGVRVKEYGKIRYSIPIEGDIIEHKDFDLARLGLDDVKDKVKFYQQDACNMDIKKFNSFDIVFAGNLIDRMKYPLVFLSSIHKHINKGGLLVIACPHDWDEQYTIKSNWVGAAKKDGENYTTHSALRDILAANFKEVLTPVDVPYVFKRNKRRFDYVVPEIVFFQKTSE